MADLQQLLSTAGKDEAVSVNQRALIEKILARYSGEFTLFRELLQNADDASASTVEMHFRTSSASGDTKYPSDRLPDLKTHNIATIVSRNDGIVFRDEDWNRLKKIAEGNPDETKIGAFGVGVKTAATPAEGSDVSLPTGRPWTTFHMGLRERAPMPEPHDFARFLSTCLGFTANIKTVSMHFDGHLLCRVNKTQAPPRLIPSSYRPVNAASPLKLLTIDYIEEVPLQLRAEVSHWLTRFSAKPKPTINVAVANAAAATTSFASKMLSAFSKSAASASPSPSRVDSPSPAPGIDPFALLSATLFLRTVSANMKVTPTPHFSAEMVRATKKSLPPRTTYSLIWTGKDEFDASQDDGKSGEKGQGQGVQGDGDARKVFEGLMSNLETNGRVFIGFPTFQTTGCAASIAARFVSTVERESLDFQARYVADWNRELLWAGGVLARTVYEEEMALIATQWKQGGLTIAADLQKKLEARAVHLMRFFAYTNSTPSPVVASETETSFFMSTRGSSITLITQLGPTPAHKTRLPNPAIANFVKGIPVLSDSVAKEAPRLAATYRTRNLVRDISLEDVLEDLAAHPSTPNEMAAVFKWWMELAANRSYNFTLLQNLKDSAMLSVADAEGRDVRIFPLGSFKTFLNVRSIPPDMPLPAHTIPFDVTKSILIGDLTSTFGLAELSMADWIRHLLTPALSGDAVPVDTNILASPHFAEKVLNVLAKGWPASTHAQAELSNLLNGRAIVPTRQGLKPPNETYFANVNLFEDLPIVTLPSGAAVKGALEKTLQGLGVRRHVELQLVFTRLLGQGDWSHVELARYLVTVRDTLSTTEFDRLKKTAWLPKEGEATVQGEAGTEGVTKKPKTVRYNASQLFPPTDAFRALGLPLIDWKSAKHPWRAGSDEAKLLFDLGLQRAPSTAQILGIAATGDNARAEAALTYFIAHFDTADTGYRASYTLAKHDLPFVPALVDGEKAFKKPSEVYSNPSASLLGFAVLVDALQGEASRLKVSRDPSPSQLSAALNKSPPEDVVKASKIFAYLSSQISSFSGQDIRSLSSAKVIPIKSVGGKVELYQPTACFFSTDAGLPAGIRALFKVIPDFTAPAKPFLVAIGVRESPSPSEIAAIVLEAPAQFFELSVSSERYLSVLRVIAQNYDSFSSTLKSKMKMTPFILGTKRLAVPTATLKKPSSLLDDSDDEDEATGSLTHQLAVASELCINDEPQLMRAFEADLLACPPDDLLESMAEKLGAQRISRLVTESYRTSGEQIADNPELRKLRRLVEERTMLFLTEHAQRNGKSKIQHNSDWLKRHLKIQQVDSIEVIYTITRRARRHTQPVSACVQVDPQGALLLSVARNLESDLYEVAHGLCRHLLVNSSAANSIMLYTVLSTSLKNLKRRGFNVDRILNARQAEREAADKRMREEQLKTQIAKANAPSEEKLGEYQQQLCELFPNADPRHLEAVLRSQSESHLDNALNQLLANPPPPAPYKSKGPTSNAPQPLSTSARKNASDGLPSIPPSSPIPSDGGLLSNWRKKFKNDASRPPEGVVQAPAAPPLSPPRPGGGGSSNMGPGSSSSARGATRNSTPGTGSTPTSTDAIRSNVLKAVQAARPGTDGTIDNEVEKTTVRESESSYCDSSASANLTYIAEIGGLRFFVSREVADGHAFVQANHDSLLRYIQQVIVPVGRVFGVDPRSLHVFHDTSGGLIAFNRGGAIYFNHRYYKAWHDHLVMNGDLAEALISTFHSLAHELAHNLVKPHDAEFSFYFSSLCEEYFTKMTQLLASIPRIGPA